MADQIHRDSGADDGRGCRTHRQGGHCPDCAGGMSQGFAITKAKPALVPLQLAAEALADVLVDYNVPAGRLVAEFRETLAAYIDMEPARCDAAVDEHGIGLKWWQ